MTERKPNEHYFFYTVVEHSKTPDGKWEWYEKAFEPIAQKLSALKDCKVEAMAHLEDRQKAAKQREYDSYRIQLDIVDSHWGEDEHHKVYGEDDKALARGLESEEFFLAYLEQLNNS